MKIILIVFNSPFRSVPILAITITHIRKTSKSFSFYTSVKKDVTFLLYSVNHGPALKLEICRQKKKNACAWSGDEE